VTDPIALPGVPFDVALLATECRDRGARVHVETADEPGWRPCWIVEVYGWPEDLRARLEAAGFEYREPAAMLLPDGIALGPPSEPAMVACGNIVPVTDVRSEW
jgi:hypothetical protein